MESASDFGVGPMTPTMGMAVVCRGMLAVVFSLALASIRVLVLVVRNDRDEVRS
jgi:hypothetical protein